MKKDLVDWLRLSLIPGVGPKRFMALVKALGDPKAVLQSSYNTLFPLVGEAVTQAILKGPDEKLIERTIAWNESPENQILCYDDDNYPLALKEIFQPPPILYLLGQSNLLHSTALAIVGSRYPTPVGKSNAEQFAHALSEVGLTIVSGLAAGIDTCAHRGGLKGIGSTIAVMATGADLIYPASNKDLAMDIAEKGLLITEFPLGSAPKQQHFPRRNRLISGLSFGCLVVEATISSGSLITSRYALEQGREVFAIPGSIHSPQSKGCHQLIKQGAKLVDDIADILIEIKDSISSIAQSPQSVEQATEVKKAENKDREEKIEIELNDPIIAVMSSEIIDIDTLAQRTGYTVSDLQVRLFELEMDGKVERLLTGQYQVIRYNKN